VEAEDRARREVSDPGAPVIEAPASSGAAQQYPQERPELANGVPAPNERCAHHSGRPAVARCDACDEPVCLTCAVPVRGRVLGPGCIAAELGDPALVAPPDPERGPSWTAVAGALVALVGTVGPWTRTGAGDRLLGAWVLDLRWSMVAAVAAVALMPVVWWWRSHDPAPWRRLVGALAGTVLVASALAVVFPPTFQAASWGPWVAAAGATIAAGGAVSGMRSERGRRQGV
jgi:hypothetical protein